MKLFIHTHTHTHTHIYNTQGCESSDFNLTLDFFALHKTPFFRLLMQFESIEKHIFFRHFRFFLTDALTSLNTQHKHTYTPYSNTQTLHTNVNKELCGSGPVLPSCGELELMQDHFDDGWLRGVHLAH